MSHEDLRCEFRWSPLCGGLLTHVSERPEGTPNLAIDKGESWLELDVASFAWMLSGL
ncbi:hypothetical protein ACU8V6_00005 [Vibrio alginolyticus]